MPFEDVVNPVVVQLKQRGTGHLVGAFHQHQHGRAGPPDRLHAMANKGAVSAQAVAENGSHMEL